MACALLFPDVRTRRWQSAAGRSQEDKVITILIVVLLLMLVGAIPAWPHSRSWGYAPSSTLGLILIILLVLAVSGRL